MKVIVAGIGKVGEALLGYLTEEGHDITAIDTDSEIIFEIVNRFDIKGIGGNAASVTVLEEAGASSADVFIALTPGDELNILCCLAAKLAGVKHTIARVRAPEYFEQFSFMREQLGIDLMINPEMEAAAAISRLLRVPSAMKIDYFAGGKIDLAEVKIPEDSVIAAKSLREIISELKVKILICAVERDDETVIPNGDFVILAGDTVHVAAKPKDLDLFFKKIGIYKHRAQSAMIIGGGIITYYLAKELIESGIRVKIVEQDRQKCVKLKNALERAEVVAADGTDKAVLFEEGIASTDGAAVLTGNDERNIVVSLFLKNLNLKKLVTKVNNDAFTGVLEDIQLDSVIAPKRVTAENIIRYIRAIEEPKQANILTLYKLAGGQAEALEFSVSEDSPIAGRALKDIKFKKNLLIAGIIRSDNAIIPDGTTEVCAGDRIIAVTTNVRYNSLDDILD